MKLIWLIVLACVAWRVFMGRWPWQKKLRVRQTFALAHAREVLGVKAGADRKDILEAHRRRLAAVHPDRGGSNEQVHEANAARDLLLAELSPESST
ncbi:J domain-containing protein [Novosphingobium mangrovi (ex Huang et al. 2023)]|uniref:J domain-containing protein n=1 Tax=Novosphingobium mangrovi (ex Huang et al. 2023) TaxID=2976432 RepID=A0ABT2I2Y1_9SPHN|nr:J domain-containing protein [Novosphingobium mangrovi (ex Huang et al. 2023)]MCT2399158.1 J domain-containing protein [Novosphingobium mangrovi (ex Huang et al. 2023)]